MLQQCSRITGASLAVSFIHSRNSRMLYSSIHPVQPKSDQFNWQNPIFFPKTSGRTGNPATGYMRCHLTMCTIYTRSLKNITRNNPEYLYNRVIQIVYNNLKFWCNAIGRNVVFWLCIICWNKQQQPGRTLKEILFLSNYPLWHICTDTTIWTIVKLTVSLHFTPKHCIKS